MASLHAVPWENEDQALQTLKEWFFPEYFPAQADSRHRAADRVQMYLTRGPVPHSIEITALLTAAKLNDESSTDASVAQMAYSMALIRYIRFIFFSIQ